MPKKNTGPKLYTPADLNKARTAMLKALADISGGRLIRGCCTQGCCDQSAQELVVRPFFAGKIKP
jgi:hypothetical protein